MSPTINFADVKGLEPVPAGKYMATIVKATESKSKAGNDMINCQWKIEGGPYDGRIVFDKLVFTEKALFRVKQTVRGLDPDMFPEGYNGDVTPDMLINKSAELTVAIEAGSDVDPETGEPFGPRNVIKKVAQPKYAAQAPVAKPASTGVFGRRK